MLLENTNNSGTITGRTAVGGIVGMGGGVSMSGLPVPVLDVYLSVGLKTVVLLAVAVIVLVGL